MAQRQPWGNPVQPAPAGVEGSQGDSTTITGRCARGRREGQSETQAVKDWPRGDNVTVQPKLPWGETQGQPDDLRDVEDR